MGCLAREASPTFRRDQGCWVHQSALVPLLIWTSTLWWASKDEDPLMVPPKLQGWGEHLLMVDFLYSRACSMSPPALLQKPSHGKFPQDSHSFEHWREACAVLGCCCDLLLQSLSHPFSVQLQFHPGKEGTLVMEGALGFLSADPSVDSSDC